MYTTVCLLALHVYGATTLSPAWNRDYDVAMKRAKVAGKPLAVFIASGNNGWTALCEDGKLGQKARRLLEDEYVCLYVDASQASEKRVVDSFEAGQLPLLVLSDRSRAYQLYRHAGALNNARLAEVLQRYTQEETPQAANANSYYTGNYYSAPCRS